jgi:Arc/MetJ family transcription regulator
MDDQKFPVSSSSHEHRILAEQSQRGFGWIHRCTSEICLLTSLISMEVHPMSRTVIDLDDQLVADVAKALGTSTKKETVNTALREVLENRRRALALTRLRATAEEGAFYLDVFEDKGKYRRYRWDQAAAAGLIATCPITELEFFSSAPTTAPGRSRRSSPSADKHRSAGPVDFVMAATAELQGLTLLHRDRDFECIAAVTGQALQWYGPEAGK